MNKIRIKCPHCGVILLVEDRPTHAGKEVKCPNCGVKNKYEDFHRVESEQWNDDTEIGKSGKQEYKEEERKNLTGKLFDEKSGKEYPLCAGTNLIGRMTYQSLPKATVPIVTDDMGISRAHLYIDVVRGMDGQAHFYVYNASNRNPTYVNSNELVGIDKIGLKDGDIISTSRTRFRFMIVTTN